MCYHRKEVSCMEEEHVEPGTENTTGYVKRPWWQILLAWLALAGFAVVLVLYYAGLFRGGA